MVPFNSLRLLVAGLALLLAAACADAPREPLVQGFSDDQPGTVLFLGTSLTAGYGLSDQEAYPFHIQAEIQRAALPFRVINAGVSGERAHEARARLNEILGVPFDVLVLETGANDMLRSVPAAEARKEIEGIVRRIRAERPGARILLVGAVPGGVASLMVPGASDYDAMYGDVADALDLSLVPNLLRGVAGRAELNLEDRMHPNAEGQRILARNVWEVLEPILRGDA